MLFSIYRTGISPPPVISFVQSEALLNHLKEAISPDIVPLGAFNRIRDTDDDLNGIKAVFIEAGIHDSLELIKQVRTVNQGACIFVLVTRPARYQALIIILPVLITA